jgi:hypothetical protein
MTAADEPGKGLPAGLERLQRHNDAYNEALHRRARAAPWRYRLLAAFGRPARLERWTLRHPVLWYWPR